MALVFGSFSLGVTGILGEGGTNELLPLLPVLGEVVLLLLLLLLLLLEFIMLVLLLLLLLLLDARGEGTGEEFGEPEGIIKASEGLDCFSIGKYLFERKKKFKIEISLTLCFFS